MPTGTIKYLSRDGDWGFISRDDKEPKVFVHISAARACGFEHLAKGQRWRFDLLENEDEKIQAGNLEPID